MPVYADPDPAKTETSTARSTWSGWAPTADAHGRSLVAPVPGRLPGARGDPRLFTTHGDEVARRIAAGENESPSSRTTRSLLREYDETGFAYRPYPHQTDYGICLSSAAWVSAVLERYPWRIEILEANWSGYQDVVGSAALD